MFRKVAFMPGESVLSVNANARDAQLIEEIQQEFHAHQGRYGSPRLHAELRDRGRARCAQAGGPG